MIDWAKCKVVGTGKDGDPFRPSIADQLTGTSWSVVYYPNDPPYQYCIVRIEAPVAKDLNLDTKSEAKLDATKLKAECDSNPHFKYRWLDQPEYPAIRTLKQAEEGR